MCVCDGTTVRDEHMCAWSACVIKLNLHNLNAQTRAAHLELKPLVGAVSTAG